MDNVCDPHTMLQLHSARMLPSVLLMHTTFRAYLDPVLIAEQCSSGHEASDLIIRP